MKHYIPIFILVLLFFDTKTGFDDSRLCDYYHRSTVVFSGLTLYYLHSAMQCVVSETLSTSAVAAVVIPAALSLYSYKKLCENLQKEAYYNSHIISKTIRIAGVGFWAYQYMNLRHDTSFSRAFFYMMTFHSLLEPDRWGWGEVTDVSERVRSMAIGALLWTSSPFTQSGAQRIGLQGAEYCLKALGQWYFVRGLTVRL